MLILTCKTFKSVVGGAEEAADESLVTENTVAVASLDKVEVVSSVLPIDEKNELETA